MFLEKLVGFTVVEKGVNMDSIMQILNHLLSGFTLLLLFFLYLVFSTVRRKFSRRPKCGSCKQGVMQQARFEPIAMNFADTRSSFGIGGKSHIKSSVIVKVTYQLTLNNF